MNKQNSSIMLAYIIFLTISLVIHLLSRGIDSLEFSAWNRIIIATTVSTYFFTIASGHECEKRLAIDIYNEDIKVNEKISQQLEEVLSQRAEDKEDNVCPVPELENALKETIALKTKLKRNLEEKIESLDSRIFMVNVMGFATFFVIACFDKIYSFFENAQDGLTMTAFILIFLTDYVAERKREKKMNENNKYNNILEMIAKYQ